MTRTPDLRRSTSKFLRNESRLLNVKVEFALKNCAVNGYLC
jgi:hypothetical protein